MKEQISVGVYGISKSININLTRVVKISLFIIYISMVAVSVYFINRELGVVATMAIFSLNFIFIMKVSFEMLHEINRRFIDLENKEVEYEN